VKVAQRRAGHPITPHSRIGLAPSVADVGLRKWMLRQPPTEVRECERRYKKSAQKRKRKNKSAFVVVN
jgi:hypothetical protein